MKQMLFIALAIILSSTSMSSYTTEPNYYSLERLRAAMTEINTVVSKKIEITEATPRVKMPKSIIADSIFKRQIRVESGGKHSITDTTGITTLLTSIAGAVGIAQFIPSTWNYMKERGIFPDYFSIDNENHQRAAQVLYMNHLTTINYGVDYDKVRLALASYNWGCGRVLNLTKEYGTDWESHLPKNVKKYLTLILGC